MTRTSGPQVARHQVTVTAGTVQLDGNLNIPKRAFGVVLFAHGSGSSRLSPRNQYVAHTLQQQGLATLLIDLLTADEEQHEARTRHLRFDIGLLTGRLIAATDWLKENSDTQELPLGYFGASTGAAAALAAAAERPNEVRAIVSRGGRPDLAGDSLPRVQAPTLLIVGGQDTVVIDLNREAFSRLTVERKLQIIPGATHLFEETGALEEVARLAGQWFDIYLKIHQKRRSA